MTEKFVQICAEEHQGKQHKKKIGKFIFHIIVESFFFFVPIFFLCCCCLKQEKSEKSFLFFSSRRKKIKRYKQFDCVYWLPHPHHQIFTNTSQHVPHRIQLCVFVCLFALDSKKRGKLCWNVLFSFCVLHSFFFYYSAKNKSIKCLEKRRNVENSYTHKKRNFHLTALLCSGRCCFLPFSFQNKWENPMNVVLIVFFFFSF